jgi:hypothetical protein
VNLLKKNENMELTPRRHSGCPFPYPIYVENLLKKQQVTKKPEEVEPPNLPSIRLPPLF